MKLAEGLGFDLEEVMGYFFALRAPVAQWVEQTAFRPSLSLLIL